MHVVTYLIDIGPLVFEFLAPLLKMFNHYNASLLDVWKIFHLATFALPLAIELHPLVPRSGGQGNIAYLTVYPLGGPPPGTTHNSVPRLVLNM